MGCPWAWSYHGWFGSWNSNLCLNYHLNAAFCGCAAFHHNVTFTLFSQHKIANTYYWHIIINQSYAQLKVRNASAKISRFLCLFSASGLQLSFMTMIYGRILHRRPFWFDGPLWLWLGLWLGPTAPWSLLSGSDWIGHRIPERHSRWHAGLDASASASVSVSGRYGAL